MVSAFTVTASTMLAPHLFKPFEIETGKSTWLLGLAGITEGAIPMAIEDPLRVIGSFVVGSMATGAIIGAMGIGLSTPGRASSLFYCMTRGWVARSRRQAGLALRWGNDALYAHLTVLATSGRKKANT